jgi:hypothetical protein
MTEKDNVHIVKLRRCDLNTIFIFLTFNNEELLESVWKLVDNFEQ